MHASKAIVAIDPVGAVTVGGAIGRRIFDGRTHDCSLDVGMKEQEGWWVHKRVIWDFFLGESKFWRRAMMKAQAGIGP